MSSLIGEDHAARAIWELVGRLDLSRFIEAIASSAEEGGRPAIDPQLLISLWVYAYSRGIGAAREVARRCEYDPAFQWLTGLEDVNYHTLADFRVERAAELDELFTHLLGALSKEGLITLEEVMQDGTKIKAEASSGVFIGKERCGSISSGRDNTCRRWAIRGNRRANRQRSKLGRAHGARSKNGWKKRCRNSRSCEVKKRRRKSQE